MIERIVFTKLDDGKWAGSFSSFTNHVCEYVLGRDKDPVDSEKESCTQKSKAAIQIVFENREYGPSGFEFFPIRRSDPKLLLDCFTSELGTHFSHLTPA